MGIENPELLFYALKVLNFKIKLQNSEEIYAESGLEWYSFSRK
ncbi:hypothetical protein PL9631_640013 [Planktothrix paucivesiculata PCC 9631]|uniref:Uncharacterized protein n=1 Tax=Planktothrix paucivesiculata PCC 9631 TaxID=671071 RepID=A0A7Z9BY77_9CYAN|nr:hypothetical protein PL9631_640013 [Planktothrix paucivesiculata PCC 9631]